MKFFLVMLLIILSACGNNEDDEEQQTQVQKEKQQTQTQKEKQQAQAQKQEEKKFKNIGSCVKTKMTEAGISANSKPPIEILQKCLSITKQQPTT